MTGVSRIGFQGISGAFSEEAAFALFGAAQTRGYASFDELLNAVDAAEVDYGLLPCENTIHGSIARSYDLLYAHPQVAIVGEAVHRIEQALIGTAGATIQGIARVQSHPVALEQCRVFLAGLPGIETVAVDDTAGAVHDVARRGDASIAAIGPAGSAARYGAVVLADAIQDDPENFTRFFAITRDSAPLERRGRACVAFVLAHETGSLYAALGCIAERGHNLRSLVARPRLGRPFEYVFYAELDCFQRTEAESVARAISSQSRVLGWY